MQWAIRRSLPDNTGANQPDSHRLPNTTMNRPRLRTGVGFSYLEAAVHQMKNPSAAFRIVPAYDEHPAVGEPIGVTREHRWNAACRHSRLIPGKESRRR